MMVHQVPSPLIIHQELPHQQGLQHSPITPVTPITPVSPSHPQHQNGANTNTTTAAAAGGNKRSDRVSTACTPCRQSKRKCTGETPACRRCSRLDLLCVYEAGGTSGRKSNHSNGNSTNAPYTREPAKKKQNTARNDVNPPTSAFVPPFINMSSLGPNNIGSFQTQAVPLNGNSRASSDDSIHLAEQNAAPPRKMGTKKRTPISRVAQYALLSRYIDRFYLWTPIFHQHLLLHRFNTGDLPQHLLFAIFSLATVVSDEDQQEDVNGEQIISDGTASMFVGTEEAARFYRGARKAASEAEVEILKDVATGKPVDRTAREDLIKTWLVLYIRDCWVAQEHGASQRQMLDSIINLLRQNNAFREDEYILSSQDPTLALINKEERRRLFWVAFRFDRLWQHFIKDIYPFAIDERQCFVNFPIDERQFQSIPLFGTISAELLPMYEQADRTVWRSLSALNNLNGRILQFHARSDDFTAQESRGYGMDDKEVVLRLDRIEVLLRDYNLLYRELRSLWSRVPESMQKNPATAQGVQSQNFIKKQPVSDFGLTLCTARESTDEAVCPFYAMFYTEYHFGLSMLHKCRADLEMARATHAFGNLTVGDEVVPLRFDISKMPSSERLSTILDDPDASEEDLEADDFADTPPSDESSPGSINNVFFDSYKNHSENNRMVARDGTLDIATFLRQVAKSMAITGRVSNLLDQPLKYRKALDSIALGLETVQSLSRLLRIIGQTPGSGGASGVVLLNRFVKYYNQLTPAVDSLMRSRDSRGPWSKVNIIVGEIQRRKSSLNVFWDSLMTPVMDHADQQFLTADGAQAVGQPQQQTPQQQDNDDIMSFSALVSEAAGPSLMPTMSTLEVDSMLSALGMNDLGNGFLAGPRNGHMNVSTSPSEVTYSEAGTPDLRNNINMQVLLSDDHFEPGGFEQFFGKPDVHLQSVRQ